MNAATDDYSSRLDAMWNFDDAEASEARFCAEVARQPVASREADEALTQVARSQALQRRFEASDATLDPLEKRIGSQPPRVRVRYLLERGRRQNSSGNATGALEWFERAFEASAADTLPGADYYRVDALHMLAIAAPAGRQLDWNLRALDAAQASSNPRTRGWRASLLNNIGWTVHERGDFKAALVYWQQALEARQSVGDAGTIRIAKWTVARGLRSVHRLDEAEAMQRALAAELATANAPDGYIFEELAEIAIARGDRSAAQPWAAKAFALLGSDINLRETDAARLARLGELARPMPPAR